MRFLQTLGYTLIEYGVVLVTGCGLIAGGFYELISRSGPDTVGPCIAAVLGLGTVVLAWSKGCARQERERQHVVGTPAGYRGTFDPRGDGPNN